MKTRLRILGVTLALASAVALALPVLYQRLLYLPPREALHVARALFAYVPLAGGAVALMLLGSGSAGARRRVLELPLKAAAALGAATMLALVAMAVGLLVDGTPLPVMLGLLISSSAVLALPPLVLFILTRAAVAEEAERLAEEAPPTGLRLSLGVQLGYALIAISAATLVPAAVLGAAGLDVHTTADARARALATGDRLALAAESLEIGAATTLVTRTPLSGGERTLLHTASGTLIPDEAAAELAELPYIEIPLGGALRGATLRVTYVAGSVGGAALLAITVVLIALTLVIATVIARAVASDARDVAAQIDRIARDQDPGKIAAVATIEMRRVTLAANRLLDRVPRLTLESFLAIERAGEASRLKAQFLANMSHDLRSPLNSILGFSELLLRGLEGEISVPQRVALAAMHATGLRLLRLLNEILDTARVESGKMELHRQSSAPVELLRQATQEAQRGRAPADADQLFVTMQPGMEVIFVDPLRLTQAVTHLINEALDVAPGEKVVLRASTDVSAGGRSFVLDLEYGRGVDAAERARLFDGFRQVKSGLHLALPLAKRLIELHGGTVQLLDVPGPIRLRAVMPVPTGGRRTS